MQTIARDRTRITRCVRVAGVASQVVLALASSACRQIVDFDPGEGPSKHVDSGASGHLDPRSACGVPFASAGCADCARTRCCPESSACAGETTCLAEATCLGDCGADPTCRARCAFEAPISQSRAASTLAACLASACEAACGLGCGLSLGDYGRRVPDAASDCHDCVMQNGCESAAACASSDDCDAYQRCMGACRTPDCQQACVLKHEAGASLALSVTNSISLCDTPCARGSNWACAGQVSWPRRTSERARLTLELNNYVSPYVGVDVSLCELLDGGCEHPVAHDRTDATGRVSFDFPNTGLQFLGFNGFLRVTSEAASFDRFWGFPLSERQFALTDEEHWYYAAHYGPAKELAALFAARGVPLDPGRSLIVVTVSDCNGEPSPDVEVTLDPLDPGVYTDYGLKPGLSATDGGGFMGFLNVPPGIVTVIATPRRLGKPSSRQAIFVRAGWSATIHMLPTP